MRNGILAAGNFIVDRVKLIDSFPAQDTLASITHETQSNGGGPYNVLKDLALMQVPYPLHAAGLIGDDPDGGWILDDLRTHRIGTTHLQQSTAHPTSYTDVMTVADTGRRTFFHQRGANAFFTGEHIDFTETTARILHLGYLLLLDHLDTFALDGKTHAANLLARARSAGLITAVDLVSAADPRFRDIVLSSLPFTDHLLLNEIEASAILGTPVDPASLQEITAAAGQILTYGIHRSITLHTATRAVTLTTSGETHHQPAESISPSVIKGTNGAGDAFAAGFLHALHENQPYPAALALAAKTAAQSLTHPTPSGGIKPLGA